MIDGLKPYPKMKDSGVDWLGEVPEHWDLRKLRHILRRHTERNRPDLPLISVVREKGVILRDTSSTDENRNFIPDDLSNYKVVRAGQFAMNKMKAWQGSYGVSPHDGIVSPAYFVFDLWGVEGDFFHTAIRSRAYVPAFTRASDGVRIGQWDLAESRMREIHFLVPPVAEQTTIVRFLDHANRRIRRYIRAKQKLIRLLEEQKQAISHGLVARGLDPNVRLKASGVEWLGDIPEHWEVSRVKTEFESLNNRRVPLSATERGAMTIRRYDYYGASGVIDKVQDYIFDDDLLLIAEDGANLVLRNLPLAIVARGKFWVNNHAHILRPRRGNIEYLAAMMERLDYLPWITGAAQPKLTKDRLMSIAIAVPPWEEQNRIVSFANRETALLRAAIDRARNEVSLLREYRLRLVADVVTGKLDVRGTAAWPTSEICQAESIEGEEMPIDADDIMADEHDDTVQVVEA